MAESRSELEKAFTAALWKTAESAKALKPTMPATAFRTMLTEYGGKETADRLLQKSQPSDGFNELYLRGREALKLSLEYVALSEPWNQLFSDEQLQVARRRLLDVECELPPNASAQTTPAAAHDVTSASSQPLPEEVPSDVHYAEGTVQRITVNRYERSAEARAACIAHHGTSCFVCGFDFRERYGDEFSGLIHVHHLKSIASVGAEYRVDPVNDLRPVCPSCHAAIHHKGGLRTPELLRAIITNNARFAR